MRPSPLVLSRRQFVQSMGAAGAGLLAGCGRLPGQVQPSKRHLIGMLGSVSPRSAESFRQELVDLGYIDGQTISIEYRGTEGAAELVQLPVEVIVAQGTPDVLAAKHVTETIPVVMVTVGDPIGTGFIASFAHPGGNITGTTQITPELSGKRLQLLRDVVPSASRIAVLWNPADPNTANQWRATQQAAKTLGVELESLEVRAAGNLSAAFEAAAWTGVDALVTLADPLLSREAPRVADLATRSRLPAMYHSRDYAPVGGLMVYGVNVPQLFRRAAYYVDRILKGTTPADLPVERPREFDFIINLQTARALGLTIPESVLIQATEVIN